MPDLIGHALNLREASSCLAFMRAELAPFGLELPTDSTLKLEVSAGKDADGTVYRPYTVLASILARVINTTHLNEGEGAKFRDANLTIAAWESDQKKLDLALGLTLPLEPSSAPFSRGSVSLHMTTRYD